MTDNSGITGIIVFSSRMDLREALRNTLKALNVPHIQVEPVTDLPNAKEWLSKEDRFLLVVDWEMGFKDIIEILESARSEYKIETRPILLIAKQPIQQVLATSYEYHVSRLHTGAISQDKLKSLLLQLFEDENQNGPLRTIISSVAQKRLENDWAGATTLLEGLNAKLPEHPKVICELAENWIESEQWNEALDLLTPLENETPPNIRALHLIGRCRMKLGDFHNASEALKKAKHINPFNTQRLIMLGNALLEDNQLEEAKANFHEASEIDPENAESKNGEGKCLLLEGEVNEALSLLKDINGPRELASLFNSSAIFAMKRGDFDHGMSLYDSALKVLKDNATLKSRLFFNKGIGFRRWKKEAEAVDCFEQALREDETFEKAKRNYLALAKKLGIEISQQFSADPEAASEGLGISPLEGFEESLGNTETKVDSLDLNLDDDDLEDESLSLL